ncbi:MAG: glycosyltransferase family 2 protein [Sodaliphilus sp.]
MKLSVIVPCYNVESYLEGFFVCLDKQWGERTDYEVIFVNDGSTDRTQALLHQYVAADTHHRVLVNQDNQGVSAARNTGMEVARGEWIAFADPDDLLAEGGYCLLMSKCLDDKIDVLSFKFQTVNENDEFNTHYHLSTNIIWEGISINRNENITPNVWAYLYRNKVVQAIGVKFDLEATFGEDALFNAILLSKGVKIRFLDTVCYCYIQRSKSVSHTTNKSIIQRSVNGLMYCIQEVQKLSNSDYSAFNWVKLFVLNIASHLMRGDFGVREVRQIRDRLIGMKVFPLTSPWRTERLYFAALAHPRLLPLVRTAVKLKKKLKRIRN